MKTKSIATTLAIALLSTGAVFAEEQREIPSSWSAELAYYEVPYRVLINKDPSGASLELDDGSIWRATDSMSARNIQYWYPNDPLVIRPCAVSWWGARFYITNERMRTAANVELSFGPIAGTPQHNTISFIDYSRKELQLQDGSGLTSYWYVDRNDVKTMNAWQPHHTIIIGSNMDCYAGWFSSSQYILINVDRNDFVRANIQ